MRTIKQFLILALVALLAGNIATAIYQGSSDRKIGPVITCDEVTLEISATAMESELLQGVTAYDPQDGDLTGQVIVASISKLISNDTAKVTYLVFDSDDNMASYVRRIRYYDYRKPTFAIDPRLPLVYPNSAEVSVLDRVTAQDVVDGDISQQIRVSTLAATDDPEVFDITLQVTNTMGDTAWLRLPVQKLGADSGRPTVELKEYLLYAEKETRFDPVSYLSTVRLASGEQAVLEDVKIEGEVDTSQVGTYRVTYSYHDNGSVGKAFLTVVVL